MIQENIALWRQVQRKNFTDWKKLAQFLDFSEENEKRIVDVAQFPLNLPYRLAEKIQKNDLSDPILRQFLPITDELVLKDDFILDPVGDQQARKSGKLLHKYQGRALLVTTSACAMHCRYCFRRNFTYETNKKGYQDELAAISRDTSIKEIILSGGDPLSLSNSSLSDLIHELSKMDHIDKIRFHSRFPIGIPERIDEELLTILAHCPKQVIFVIHCNHPKELDEDVCLSLKKIQRLGIPMLNQSVLLKGVNDQIFTMKDLLEKLSNHGIIPYYLHQLDRAQGTSHFETSEDVGTNMIKQLTKEMPGYSIPKFVKEIAGMPSKTPIM
jgi:EF-P beta-lysylation protein EpmB